MADKEKDVAKHIAEATNKTIDEITGILEAIGQTINDVFKGRNVFEVILLGAVGTLSISAFFRKITDLLKGTSDEEIMARQMIRDYYQEILESYATKAGKAVKDFYQHLASQKLMEDDDFEAFINAIKDQRVEFDEEREKSTMIRKWFLRFFVGMFTLLAFVSGTSTETLTIIGKCLLGLVLLVGIGWLIHWLYKQVRRGSSNDGSGNQITVVTKEN